MSFILKTCVTYPWWTLLIHFLNLIFRIQQADGGFFEKFGVLIQEHNEELESQELNTLSPTVENRSLFIDTEQEETRLQEEDAEIKEDEVEPEVPEPPPKPEGDTKSEVSSDTESEGEVKELTDYLPMGWNVSKIYFFLFVYYYALS